MGSSRTPSCLSRTRVFNSGERIRETQGNPGEKRNTLGRLIPGCCCNQSVAKFRTLQISSPRGTGYELCARELCAYFSRPTATNPWDFKHFVGSAYRDEVLTD